MMIVRLLVAFGLVCSLFSTVTWFVYGGETWEIALDAVTLPTAIVLNVWFWLLAPRPGDLS